MARYTYNWRCEHTCGAEDDTDLPFADAMRNAKLHLMICPVFGAEVCVDRYDHAAGELDGRFWILSKDKPPKIMK